MSHLLTAYAKDGLNLHYKWEGNDPPVDFVVKVSLHAWASAPIRKEIHMTKVQ